MSRWARYGPGRLIVHLALLLLLGTPAAASPERPLVWALGDSLTAGYGLPPAQGFTRRLQESLRRSGVPAEVRNGGVSGDTAAQGRARLLWGLRGLKARPDLVLVELGANDMLRGLPPEQTEANLDRILTELKRRGVPVLLAGMRAAPNLGPAYRARFEAIYPRLARKHGVPLYPFFLDGVAGDRALFQADGLHPNARGVDVVVRRITPAVRRALLRSSPGGGGGPPRLFGAVVEGRPRSRAEALRPQPATPLRHRCAMPPPLAGEDREVRN